MTPTKAALMPAFSEKYGRYGYELRWRPLRALFVYVL